jgi:hypothetical protein
MAGINDLIPVLAQSPNEPIVPSTEEARQTAISDIKTGPFTGLLFRALQQQMRSGRGRVVEVRAQQRERMGFVEVAFHIKLGPAKNYRQEVALKYMMRLREKLYKVHKAATGKTVKVLPVKFAHAAAV